MVCTIISVQLNIIHIYARISLQQQTSDDPSAFAPFTQRDGVYWVDVNVETGVIEDLLYDSQLGGNG